MNDRDCSEADRDCSEADRYWSVIDRDWSETDRDWPFLPGRVSKKDQNQQAKIISVKVRGGRFTAS
jgi:hypothetical protein